MLSSPPLRRRGVGAADGVVWLGRSAWLGRKRPPRPRHCPVPPSLERRGNAFRCAHARKQKGISELPYCICTTIGERHDTSAPGCGLIASRRILRDEPLL